MDTISVDDLRALPGTWDELFDGMRVRVGTDPVPVEEAVGAYIDAAPDDAAYLLSIVMQLCIQRGAGRRWIFRAADVALVAAGLGYLVPCGVETWHGISPSIERYAVARNAAEYAALSFAEGRKSHHNLSAATYAWRCAIIAGIDAATIAKIAIAAIKAI